MPSVAVQPPCRFRKLLVPTKVCPWSNVTFSCLTLASRATILRGCSMKAGGLQLGRGLTMQSR